MRWSIIWPCRRRWERRKDRIVKSKNWQQRSWKCFSDRASSLGKKGKLMSKRGERESEKWDEQKRFLMSWTNDGRWKSDKVIENLEWRIWWEWNREQRRSCDMFQQRQRSDNAWSIFKFCQFLTHIAPHFSHHSKCEQILYVNFKHRWRSRGHISICSATECRRINRVKISHFVYYTYLIFKAHPHHFIPAWVSELFKKKKIISMTVSINTSSQSNRIEL